MGNFTIRPSLRRITAPLLIATVSLSLSACAGMSHRDRDVAIGAGVGAVAGAVVTGGSTAGTAAGAVVGGVVGNEVHKKKRREEERE